MISNSDLNQYYSNSVNYARNRRKNSNGNVMKYLIPGLQQAIDIPFPDRKLPVCKKCKKIYKTRELCRVRDGHTDVPWNTTYLCITLDESCFTRDHRGNLSLASEGSNKFIARSLPGPPMPYRAKQGHIKGAKAPICMACKDKNYTRHHCRESQKHQQLPWGAIYVLLSAVPSNSGNRGFPTDNTHPVLEVGSKRSAENISSVASNVSSGTDDGSSSKRMKGDESSTSTSDNSAVGEESVSDDIHKIESSRAILLTIKGESCVLKWLEMDPHVPNSAYEPAWDNQCKNVDQGPMYNHASPQPQFRSDAYPPPPPGWSGYGNTNHSDEPFSPEFTGSMGNGPKMNSDHNGEFNCQPCTPYNRYEQYNNYFPPMQQNAGINSPYANSTQDEGGQQMYPEDDAYNRSNMMYPPPQKNCFVPHQNNGMHRNFQSQSPTESANSMPNMQVQYRNQEHGGPRPIFPPPPQQTRHFQNAPKRSVPNRPQSSNGSFYPGRFENYPNHNAQGEEWGPPAGRPQGHNTQQQHFHNANRGNPYRGNTAKKIVIV